jgi:iron complex outermembrane receptor protein
VVEDEEDSLPVVQFQQADARFTGFEADLSLPPMEIPMGTLSTRFVADYVRAKLKDGGDLPQIPPLRLGGELAFERDRLLSTLSVTYYGQQDRVAVNELPTDEYTLVDVDVSYRMPAAGTSMLLFLRGQNLLDEEARRHTSPLKDVAPLPGRGAAAGVRLEF